MIRNTIFILCFFLFSVNIFSQSFTKNQFVEDLDFLKTELPKRHKNLFEKLSQEDFNSRVDEIKSKCDSLTLENFEIELFKLVKSIGDEHTRIEPPFKSTYPINFDFFKEGIFVTSTDSTKSHLLYSPLNGIEKFTNKRLIEKFKTVIQNENDPYFKVYFLNFINNPDFLYGLKITESNSNAQFVLDNNNVELTSIAKNEYKKFVENQLVHFKKSDNYWFEFLNEKILYFNYQKCQEQNNKSFQQFNDELFKEVENKTPKKIIIDLRNNDGGNSGILDPFLEKLKDSYLNKRGSLFVLIGKNTFSSSLMNAINLKRNYNSILVGQSTSGNINHYGETRGFYLPNTRIVVGYSTRYWENWKGHDGPLKPDVEIEYSINNFKEGKDEAIEYVIKK